jgi:hypothetical protein
MFDSNSDSATIQTIQLSGGGRRIPSRPERACFNSSSHFKPY